MKKVRKIIIYTLIFCISIVANILLSSFNASASRLMKDNLEKSSKSVFEQLEMGNEKYVKARTNDSEIGENIRKKLYKNGQDPDVVILTCADSRVIPENIFYTGPGKIIVARVAGNVVDDSVLGTIEFAVDQKKVPLVVVMGHEDCGAIHGALSGNIKGKLGEVIKQVIPSVETAKKSEKSEAEIFNKAIELNVENSINIISKDEIVKKYIDSGKVKVIGANYNLQTGKVKWLDKKAC